MLTYHGAPGSNGNRIGVYGTVQGARTETWAPAAATFSGGVSPERWKVELDFSALRDTTNAVVPTTHVRKMRWTWGADLQSGNFARSEFAVAVTNWSVSGTNLQYSVAGTGSRRIEDDSAAVAYEGHWVEARGNYSGGSIRWTDTPGARVSCSYSGNGDHWLYLGTRLADRGGQVAVQVDGGTAVSLDLRKAAEDVLVRVAIAAVSGQAQHTVTITHTGANGTVVYFDFLEIAYPSVGLPDFERMEQTTLATDWDTDHSVAIAPERTAWLIQKLGFHGRANHYAGAMWFYELHRQGHSYASGTVTFSGEPEFGKKTQVFLGPTPIEHLNLIGDTAESIATSFELSINAGSTGVWARAEGAVLTITSRLMGSAGNAVGISASTNITAFTAVTSGATLAGGVDGFWRTDTAASVKLNRAARDWNRAFFQALQGYGIAVTAAFSMELQHGDDTPEAHLAQRYPNGDPVWLNTPALQTNFGPESTAFWREVYREMAGLMASAGVRPYVQFGEVQWWYFASGAGMPFYDSYTTSCFEARYGKPMAAILSQHADPSNFPDECAFLPEPIGEFTSAVMTYVRQAHPDAQFEVLYPPDVNDTALNRLVNFPHAHWTPATLDSLKTEKLHVYGGSRSQQGGGVDTIADATGIWAMAEQPPGGNRRVHDAMEQGTADGGGRRAGLRGAVRTGSVLPDWISFADGTRAATVAVHGELKSDAAVDAEDLAGDVIVRLQQETDGARDVVGATESRDHAFFDESIVLASGDAGLRHSSGRDSGTDHVDAKIWSTAKFFCEEPRGMLERGLLGGVYRGAGEEGVGLHGRHQDDGARSSGGLHAGGGFAGEQDGTEVVGGMRKLHGVGGAGGIGKSGGVAGQHDQSEEVRSSVE